MPANAVDYLIDDHMTKPLTDEGFMKLLVVMKKAPKCSPHCKALAPSIPTIPQSRLPWKPQTLQASMLADGAKFMVVKLVK